MIVYVQNRHGSCFPINFNDEQQHKIKEVKKALTNFMPIDSSLLQIWIERQPGFGEVLQDEDLVIPGVKLDFCVRNIIKPELMGTFEITANI